MKKIKTFTDLVAWQKAHKLVLTVYKVTTQFPKSEQFGLTGQIRRAGVSVSSNIAEGFRRETYKEKVRFYNMASASLNELQNQILVARDVNYINNQTFQSIATQTVEVSKLLHGLIKSSKRKM